MRTVTAAVSRDHDKPLSLEQVTLQAPRPDEVVVEIDAVGVCHTDLGSHLGLLGTQHPVVLGHEGAGRVVEVGAEVTSLQPGDPVLLTAATCGNCRSCLNGTPAYCDAFFALNAAAARADGSSAYEGGELHSHFFGQSSFAECSVVAARNAIKLPDDIAPHAAAPLACGIMTGAATVIAALGVRPGSTIAIFGAGAVGLSAAMAAQIAGATAVIVVDVVRERLDLASELGATAVIDAASTDAVEAVRELTHGGADYTVEATGVDAGLRGAIEALGSRGVCGVVGLAGMGAVGSFDWMSLIMKGATIRGTTVGDANARLFLPQLLAHHRAGRFPFERMLTYYDLADINDAMQAAASGAVIKPVLRVR